VYFNMWPLSDVLMKVVNNEGNLILCDSWFDGGIFNSSLWCAL